MSFAPVGTTTTNKVLAKECRKSFRAESVLLDGVWTSSVLSIERLMSEFKKIRDRVRLFAEDRDWEQFHSPKNLAMALSAEVGELVEHFQWLTEDQSRSIEPETLAEIADEIADVQIYLIRLADKLELDIPSSVAEKIEKNECKYPADRVKGDARKYTKYKTNAENDG